MADGEPKAHALWLAGVERMKNPVKHVLSDARAVVPDGDDDMIPGGSPRNLNSPQFRRAGNHGVGAVAQQVQDHLLDLDTVGSNFGKVGWKVLRHVDLMVVQLVFCKHQGIAGDLLQPQGNGVRAVLADESP